jgi:hypothetical protein
MKSDVQTLCSQEQVTGHQFHCKLFQNMISH